jgi:hypothetical protein
MTTEIDSKLESIRQAVNDIRAAIIARGVDMGGMPFSLWYRAVADLPQASSSKTPAGKQV